MPVSLPFGRKLRVIVSFSDRFQGPVKISQFMLQGPSSKSHQTLPETRSLLLWLSLVNKGKCGYVCLWVQIHFSLSLSVSITPYRTYLMIQGWVTEWGLSRWSLCVRVCVVEWVHTEYGEIINLLTQLKTKSAPIHVINFTWAFSVIQDVTKFHWQLFSFQIAVKSNIWTLIYIFYRKCSDASLHQVITSLPVETLQVYHMETIKMWTGDADGKYEGGGGGGLFL